MAKSLPPSLEKKLQALSDSYKGVGHLEPAPRFAYLGEGAVFGSSNRVRIYVLFAQSLPQASERDALERLPAPLRHEKAWHGPLLRVGTHDTHIVASYGKNAGGAALLLRQLEAEVSKPGYDRKAVRWVREAMKVASDALPWRNFYDDLHAWLLALHAEYPIELVLRSASREERAAGLGATHRASLTGLFDVAIPRAASLAQGAADVGILREMAGELVIHAADAAANDQHRVALLPLVTLAHTIDEYAEASQKVLFALPDAELFRYVEDLSPLEGIVLFLRTDCVGRFAERPAAGHALEACLRRFWTAAPTESAVSKLRFYLLYALFPAWTAGEHNPVFEAVAGTIAQHRDALAPLEEFRALIASFEQRGYPSAARQLEKALGSASA